MWKDVSSSGRFLSNQRTFLWKAVSSSGLICVDILSAKVLRWFVWIYCLQNFHSFRHCSFLKTFVYAFICVYIYIYTHIFICITVSFFIGTGTWTRSFKVRVLFLTSIVSPCSMVLNYFLLWVFAVLGFQFLAVLRTAKPYGLLEKVWFRQICVWVESNPAIAK